MAKLREILASLPTKKEFRKGEAKHFCGFRIRSLQGISYQREYTKRWQEQTIVVEYQIYTMDELRPIYIFWQYPDFIIFCGRQEIVEYGRIHLENELRQRGILATFTELECDHYYFLKIYETCQETQIWMSSGLDRESPPEIADGVIANSMQDVSTELDKKSDQARIVQAKGSSDCTRDLTTALSVLVGRKLRRILVSIDMEEKVYLVRLSSTGKVFVRKPSKISKSNFQEELSRLLWGLEFTKRIANAYSKWLEMAENRLPNEDVYVRSRDVVRKLVEPVLKNSLNERLKELKDERKKLKKVGVN